MNEIEFRCILPPVATTSGNGHHGNRLSISLLRSLTGGHAGTPRLIFCKMNNSSLVVNSTLVEYEMLLSLFVEYESILLVVNKLQTAARMPMPMPIQRLKDERGQR